MRVLLLVMHRNSSRQQKSSRMSQRRAVSGSVAPFASVVTSLDDAVEGQHIVG